MNLLWTCVALISSWNLLVKCSHEEFSPDACLQAHNDLRKLHVETNNVMYSDQLEKDAQLYADQLKNRDTTIDVRPTRVLPKRRKRHLPDINPNVQLETWDGEIFYPKGSSNRNENRVVKIGENIHKFCCTTFPHCPKQFFHNLVFPPTAGGVVKDWYNQQIGDYDFDTGEKKTSFSQVNNFASIVWKKTTKIGCAQSAVSARGCVFTIVLYEEEGSVGNAENFRNNIGKLVSDEESSGRQVLIIFLSIFFVGLIIALLACCYCCRKKINEKYTEFKIKTDTMKAEQELETDSTSFWWLRIFRRRRKAQRRRTTVSRPRHVSLKEKPTIEVIPNSAPQRTRPIPPRVRGSSNAAAVIKYQGISQKPQNMVVQDNYGFDGHMSNRSSPATPFGKKLARQPSLSGKAPPPPVPQEHIYGNLHDNSPSNKPSHLPPPRPPPAKKESNASVENPYMNKPPAMKVPSKPQVAARPSVPGHGSPRPTVPGHGSPKPKPKPAPRTESPSTKPKPLLPPGKKPPPRPQPGGGNDDDSPKSVAQMREFLERQ